jgi:hypothetical protein
VRNSLIWASLSHCHQNGIKGEVTMNCLPCSPIDDFSGQPFSRLASDISTRAIASYSPHIAFPHEPGNPMLAAGFASVPSAQHRAGDTSSERCAHSG